MALAARILDRPGPVFRLGIDGADRHLAVATRHVEHIGRLRQARKPPPQPAHQRLPGREIEGVFETIDETGALVLATPGGRATLAAAEIHFPDETPAHAARD